VFKHLFAVEPLVVRWCLLILSLPYKSAKSNRQVRQGRQESLKKLGVLGVLAVKKHDVR
jgi:hypothetical protein